MDTDKTLEAPPRWSIGDFIFAYGAGLAAVILAAGAVGEDPSAATLAAVVLPAQYAGHLAGLLFVSNRRGTTMASGFGFDIQPTDLRYLGLGALLQLALVFLALPFYEWLELEETGQSVVDLAEDIRGTFPQLVLVLTIALLAPIIEELMFRGLLVRYLAQRMTNRWVILVSALVFSAVHVFTIDLGDERWAAQLAVLLPSIFLMGLPLAWLTLRHGRLGPAIFTHAGFNLWTVIALFVPESG